MERFLLAGRNAINETATTMRYAKSYVEHGRMKSSFMCFLSCLLIPRQLGWKKTGSESYNGEGTAELLGYSTSTSMLNIKTARSFTIVPHIKWIFQSLPASFIISFHPIGSPDVRESRSNISSRTIRARLIRDPYPILVYTNQKSSIFVPSAN